MHKGIHFRVLINGEPILITDSLAMHYKADLHRMTYSAITDNNWCDVIPLMELNNSGCDIVQVQMMAGEFAEAPEE